MGGGIEREEERENWRRIERKGHSEVKQCEVKQCEVKHSQVKQCEVKHSEVKQDLDEAHVMQVVCDTKETKHT